MNQPDHETAAVRNWYVTKARKSEQPRQFDWLKKWRDKVQGAKTRSLSWNYLGDEAIH